MLALFLLALNSASFFCLQAAVHWRVGTNTGSTMPFNTDDEQDFLVIGLGRFGTSVALRLKELGYGVLGVDRNRELVQSLVDDLTEVVALDATDGDALRAVGIDAFTTAVIGIGSDFESNVLITVLLKELGVPNVICKALNQRQKAVLLRVGADQVILPEHEAGVRLAHRLVTPYLLERLELEPGVSVSEVRCPGPLAGHTLRELDLRKRFGITVLMIKGGQVRVSPAPDDAIHEGDVLLVIGPDSGVAELQKWKP